MNLTKKMHEVAEVLNAYDVEKKIIQQDYDKAKEDANRRHAQNLQDNDSARDSQLDDADRRRKAWKSTISGANDHMQKLRKQLAAQVYFAAHEMEFKSASESDIPTNLRKMRDTARRNFPMFRPGDNDAMLATGEEAVAVMERYQQASKETAAAAEKQYAEEREYTIRLHTRNGASEEARYSEELNDIETNNNNRNGRLNSTLFQTFTTDLDPQGVIDTYSQLMENIPQGELYTPPETFPDHICFGYAGYDVTADMQDGMKRKAITAGLSCLLEEQDRSAYLRFPYGYGLDDPRFSTMFEYDKTSRAQIVDHMQAMVLRIMMSIPAGKAWLTLIDPEDTGKNFSMFAPLGEADDRAIDTRIWIDSGRIEERLAMIIDHTSDVHFRCLQGRFENILEYNALAGKTAEPLRFLVVMGFPHAFSHDALEKLNSIVTNGPSTGVYALIAADAEAMEQATDPLVQRIREKINLFPCYNGQFFTSDVVNGKNLRFVPIANAEGQTGLDAVQKVKDAITAALEDGTVITLEDIYGKDLRTHYMAHDASNGICIPIGLEGANQRTELRLGGVSDGGKAHAYHAMIGGSIGSGKTALLHNIILSTLMCYSPNEVQMYLIDMKDGVEFKRYAPFMELRNLRILAIKAEKEFGYAVLSDLMRTEQSMRSQLFKQEGVSRIETYNEKMRRENHLDKILPRLVVVIDEIQWLFNSEDDPLVKDCARLLESLVLQGGSAYGIQLILATQDWANVRGLSSQLYNNIQVRISLKSNRESGRLLLDDSSEVLDRLPTLDAGQAVFNEYTGHRDYNREFRGTFITRKESDAILTELLAMQKEDNRYHVPERKRLLSSDIADNDYQVLTAFARTQQIVADSSMKYRLWPGEGLQVVNTFRLELGTQCGQNLLLVGNDETTASIVAGFSALSLIYETIRMEGNITKPVITVFDFSDSNMVTGMGMQPMLKAVMEKVPDAFRVFGSRDMLDGLKVLEQEMDAGADEAQHFVIFFGLNRARRLISPSAYDVKPRDILVNLIRRGPENGYNFIVWTNTPGQFEPYYGDMLKEFELRMVFNNTDETLYDYFVQDKKPVDDGDEDRVNALSYNLDGDNQLVKLYTDPSLEWLDRVCAALNQYID